MGARPAPLWLRVARDTALLPGIVTALVPWLLLRAIAPQASLQLGQSRWIGVVPLALGLVGYATCALHFARTGRGTPAPWDAPQQLVASGPYRWVRNPMYLAVLCVVLGLGLLNAHAALLIYAGFVALLFHVRVVAFEEPQLAQRFGSSFADYRATVPRWLPRRPARRRTGERS